MASAQGARTIWLQVGAIPEERHSQNCNITVDKFWVDDTLDVSMAKKTRKRTSKTTPSVREALLLLKDASVAEIDHLIDNLHQVKAAREHLEQIFSGSISAARKVARTVAQTVVEEAAKVAPKKRGRKPGLEKTPRAGVARRGRRAGKFLGPARPGTLRAFVHAALKELGPTRTNELVKHLENKLGTAAGKSLRIRVSQVLINERDPFIKRVSRGVYQHT